MPPHDAREGRVARWHRDPQRIGVLGDDHDHGRPHRRRQREGAVGRAAVAGQHRPARVEGGDGGARDDGAVLVPQRADQELVGLGGERRRNQRAKEGDLQEAFTSVA